MSRVDNFLREMAGQLFVLRRCVEFDPLSVSESAQHVEGGLWEILDFFPNKISPLEIGITRQLSDKALKLGGRKPMIQEPVPMRHALALLLRPREQSLLLPSTDIVLPGFLVPPLLLEVGIKELAGGDHALRIARDDLLQVRDSPFVFPLQKKFTDQKMGRGVIGIEEEHLAKQWLGAGEPI